jgi:glycosyltransferase involved in cell wall biosynthesis
LPGRSLSIFFPMYNERDNIAATLDRALQVIPTLGCTDYEILVVDDGSKDGSAEVVRGFMRRDPRVRLVQHPKNLGYGAALRTGFTSASSDLVFYTDSDLPMDLSEIARALPHADEADLVIGYRIQRFDTPRRALYSRVYNTLMRILFGVRVRDVNFSFKLVHRRVLERIRLSAETVFIDGQLLAEARRIGARIVELPIDYQPRRVGSSSFNSLRAAFSTLSEMLRYRFAPGSMARVEPLAVQSLPAGEPTSGAEPALAAPAELLAAEQADALIPSAPAPSARP